MTGLPKPELERFVYLSRCGCSVCELAEWFQLPVFEVIELWRAHG
ncbi:hypothetical protein [Lysobacter sp. GX 14042]|nr:hypothetical protein [Lysobacter sp. GX 14042]